MSEHRAEATMEVSVGANRATTRNPSVRGRKRAWSTSEEPWALILTPESPGCV